MRKAIWLALILIGMTGNLHAAESLSLGQSIYVSVYSHIFHGNHSKSGNPEKMLLSAMLSVRNIDIKSELILKSVAYYDTNGRLIKEYCSTEKNLAALAFIALPIGRYNRELT